MKRYESILVVSLLVSFGLGTALSLGDDWPQWRGQNRDDVSTEDGLLTEWPEGGPPSLWRNEKCGLGYAGFSVVGDRLFTMGQEDGKQFLICLNADQGTENWRTEFGGDYQNNWGDGPRSTPTVDGDEVFALSADGVLFCAEAATGKKIWSVNLTDFGGKIPGWGYCESVLVDGDRVVCTPGGGQGAVVALKRSNGEMIWQSKDITEDAHYSSIVPATIDGKKQYVQLMVTSLVGIDPENGSVIWTASFPGRVAVIPTPIVHNNSVYVSSGYNAGCQRVDVSGESATIAWSNKVMKNHHGGVVRLDDHLFGYSDNVGWVCQDWNTGESVWAEKSKLGKGAIAYAGERLYCISESNGEVVLLEPSTSGWKEHGRFTLSR
jgi:outer membrane protein assembly factor BamB